MLPDSGRLQEEEAAFANKMGYSRHAPAKPLYTEADAKACLPALDTIGYSERRELAQGIAVTFRPAGHILGSATVEVSIDEPGRTRQNIVFTGDLGRYDAPVIPDPSPVREATTLLVESTYGDRAHGAVLPKDALAGAVNEAATRNGAIVIPSFAIGRAQEILYHLRELENEARIPVLDVFVDSPMAIDATPIYAKHIQDHDAQMQALLNGGKQPFHPRKVHFTRSVEDSKRINDCRKCIVISASGMATGGRVLHHLKHRLPDLRNTILFVGFQSEGTRGRTLQDGAKEVKIHGQFVQVAAQIRTVSGFSAHADHLEMMRWLDGFASPPARVLCVHGEDKGLRGMKEHIESRGPGWNVTIPRYLETVDLD
jgi:metallo-beta-lactamase family protein